MKIDVVITWVNTNDKKWQKIYEKHTGNAFVKSDRYTTGNDAEAELKMCLYCIRKHMKWVNKTYIVTMDKQIPTCLKNEILIHHSEIDLKPVFNSHAIESSIHKIPGLLENFIYMNDDFYVIKHVSQLHFFNKNGLPIVRLGDKFRMMTGILADHKYIEMMNRISENLGYPSGIALNHVPHGLTKTIMRDAEKKFDTKWVDTTNSMIRHQCDNEIAPIFASLLLALKNKKATTMQHAKLYHSFLPLEVFKITSYRPHVVCINAYSGSYEDLRSTLLKKSQSPILKIIAILICFLSTRLIIACIIDCKRYVRSISCRSNNS